jgi:hypothetical protein
MAGMLRLTEKLDRGAALVVAAALALVGCSRSPESAAANEAIINGGHHGCAIGGAMSDGDASGCGMLALLLGTACLVIRRRRLLSRQLRVKLCAILLRAAVL